MMNDRRPTVQTELGLIGAPANDVPSSLRGTLIFESPEQAKGYTIISNLVLFDPTISPGAKTTYALFLSFAWQENQSYPGQQRLAEILGVSDRHVRRYLSELIAKEYIQVKRRGLGKTNIYIITDLSRVERITEAKAKWLAAPVKRIKSEADRTLVSDQERTQMSYKQDSVEKDSEHSKFRKGEDQKEKGASYSSEPIARIISDLSKRELQDPIHIHSNITQAQNLWRSSRSSEDEFVQLIREARRRTLQHAGAIRKLVPGSRGTKNRAPYFFKVLKVLSRQAALADFRRSFKAPP